jgi:hypothetical protein
LDIGGPDIRQWRIRPFSTNPSDRHAPEVDDEPQLTRPGTHAAGIRASQSN